MWVFQPSPIKTFAVSHRQIPQCIQHESFLSIDSTPSSSAERTVDLGTRIEIELSIRIVPNESHKKCNKKLTNLFGQRDLFTCSNNLKHAWRFLHADDVFRPARNRPVVEIGRRRVVQSRPSRFTRVKLRREFCLLARRIERPMKGFSGW